MKNYIKLVSKISLAVMMMVSLSFASVKAAGEASGIIDVKRTYTYELNKPIDEVGAKAIPVTVVNDKFKSVKEPGVVASECITNLPKGLTAYLVVPEDGGSTTGNFRILGTPTEESHEAITITVSGKYLESGKDLVVTVNPNAKWAIGNVPEPTPTPPAPTPEPTPTPTPTAGGSPKTSTTSNVGGYFTLLMLSGIVFVGYTSRKNRSLNK